MFINLDKGKKIKTLVANFIHSVWFLVDLEFFPQRRCRTHIAFCWWCWILDPGLALEPRVLTPVLVPPSTLWICLPITCMWCQIIDKKRYRDSFVWSGFQAPCLSALAHCPLVLTLLSSAASHQPLWLSNFRERHYKRLLKCLLQSLFLLSVLWSNRHSVFGLWVESSSRV